MSGVRRGLVTLVLAVGLFAGGAMTGVSAADVGNDHGNAGAANATLAADAATTQATDTIRLDQVFTRTPEESGSVSVEHRYSVPDRVVSLETSVPDNATVTDTSGFEPRNDTYYTWDGREGRPTIAYQYPVNRTAARSGPKAANGSYLSVDVGEWALFTRPDTSVDFRYTGEERPEFVRSSIVGGEGAAGEWLVYLGPEDTFTREADEQTFRLVVPASASMTESPRTVLGSLERASDRLRVGDHDEEVFVVAAPTAGVSWGVRGLQTGDADMWVRDSESLSDPANVWLHEYVHTRQSFTTDPDARWLDESLPAYYATLFTFEHRSLTFDGFAEQLARGNRTAYDNVTLSTPSTWHGFADYYKGGLVTGDLDRRLRTASDGNRTLQTVFARLNARDRVNESQFLEEIERAGDERAVERAMNQTQTETTVAMWNRSAHRSAFGPLPARVEYALPDGEADAEYRVDGPYRNVTATPESPIELVTGETLEIDVRATNRGGTAGTFDATFRLNDTRVASDSGQVAPNETAVVTLEHTFALPGRYVASVDGESVVLRVRRPTSATVTNLTVEPGEVRQGERAVATVTVQNFADEPAQRELVLTRDFREVARGTVRLGANETERAQFGVEFPQAGSARIGVNSRATEVVSVEPVPIDDTTPTADGTEDGTATATTPETATGTSEGTGAGFGVAVAVMAVAVGAVLARWRTA